MHILLYDMKTCFVSCRWIKCVKQADITAQAQGAAHEATVAVIDGGSEPAFNSFPMAWIY